MCSKSGYPVDLKLKASKQSNVMICARYQYVIAKNIGKKPAVNSSLYLNAFPNKSLDQLKSVIQHQVISSHNDNQDKYILRNDFIKNDAQESFFGKCLI